LGNVGDTHRMAEVPRKENPAAPAMPEMDD
jgi:hypothetical protein